MHPAAFADFSRNDSISSLKYVPNQRSSRSELHVSSSSGRVENAATVIQKRAHEEEHWNKMNVLGRFVGFLNPEFTSSDFWWSRRALWFEHISMVISGDEH